MTTAELILSVVVAIATLANGIMMTQIKLAVSQSQLDTEKQLTDLREWVRTNFVQLQAQRRGDWKGNG